jgi:hypothetical protein
MHKKGKDNSQTNYQENGLSRKGESVYYLGTFIFISGIILLSVGALSIIFFQIHYESEVFLIQNTILFIGSGLIFISLGINLMIRQSKRGKYVYSLGLLFSASSMLLFLLNYQDNWFYPVISYVLLLYIFGFLMLMGNAFGSVTVWLLRNTPVETPTKIGTPQHEYTDEEIQKDIEAALKKSLEKSAEQLRFDYVDTHHLKIGKNSYGSETVVRVKDDMSEALTLKDTMNPGATEKWGGTGIEKASLQLAETLKGSNAHKQGFFSRKFFGKK